ncbi:hypothetical protein K3495_g15606 [Podosphaera aphanis]|nr:hypothetical protein K3495_g15606 [Podosphaera aphanis]
MANPTPSEANASESFFVSQNKVRSSLSMSFSNVTQLTGRDTHDTWAAIMDAIWYSQQLGEMVIEGKKHEKDDSPEEREAYMLLSKYAITVFVQVCQNFWYTLDDNVNAVKSREN